jgi:hypothetical protein
MIIINFILFQLAWFACVLGAANNLPWLGVVVTAAVVWWHLAHAKPWRAEMRLMLCVLIIGASFDQLLLSFALVDYVHHGWSATLVPVWILALWLGFGTALNVSLRWMRGRHFVAVLFGAIGGPVAYIGAEKLGAVVLIGNPSYIALAIGWAIITPLLLHISSQADGYRTYTN